MSENNKTLPWNPIDRGDVMLRIDPRSTNVHRGSANLRIEWGRSQIARNELEKWRSGAILHLNNTADDLAEIYADEQWIGRGEVLVVDGKYAVRLVEVAAQGKGGE
jgi:flagellar motor switch/type III secretory pathway protein FliN